MLISIIFNFIKAKEVEIMKKMNELEMAIKENMTIRTEAIMHGLEIAALPENADEKYIRENTQNIKNMILEFITRDELRLKKEVNKGKAVNSFIKDIDLEGVQGNEYYTWLVLTTAGEVRITRQCSSLYDIWWRICKDAATKEDILKFNEKVR